MHWICLNCYVCYPQISLWTLGQLVESTGYVVEPYHKYPTLLDVLLNFLKTEQSSSIRREVSAPLYVLFACAGWNLHAA